MTGKKLSRRDFLRSSAAAAALLASGTGLVLAQDPTATPAPLPEGAAGKLTVIHKTEYFAEVQELFRETVVEFAADKGVELDISTANPEAFGDFLAKMLAAVQAGNPPDLGYHALSIQQMYALDIVEDVTDVVDQAIEQFGIVVPALTTFRGQIDGRWYGVPFATNAGAWFARKDLFEAKGIDVYSLETWDDYRDAALAVSDPENNVWGWGFTVNQSGDGHGLILSVIQSYGGSFTDETGTVVTFNTPETIAAVNWLAETYTSETYAPMLPPGVESWTDTSNNEAYLAGTIAMTLNQPTLYAKARLDGNPVFENTAVLHQPHLEGGPLYESGNNFWLTIFKGAPNIDLAKELILTLLDPARYTPMVQVGGGMVMPTYQDLWTDDLLAADPNFEVFRDILFNPTVFYGTSHPATPNAVIDAVVGASILNQMMANITTGAMDVETAVQDAHDKMVQIFEEAGVPQS